MKNVNFKKIASIVLAVTLVLSIIAPVPAAAAEPVGEAGGALDANGEMGSMRFRG